MSEPGAVDAEVTKQAEIPSGLNQRISEVRSHFSESGIQFQGSNLLATVHNWHRSQSDDKGEYSFGLVVSARQAASIAKTRGIENPVDPSLVANVLTRGAKRVSGEIDQGSRPPVYPTVKDRIDAADTLIDERTRNAENYPYYEYYRERGLLHEDDSGVPYVEIYRRSGSDAPVQLAGGLREGTFSIEELTELPLSVRIASVEGFAFSSHIAEMEELFALDNTEAYGIGACGHEFTPYLSATLNSDRDGDIVYKLHVPAHLTLPVTMLQVPVEQHALSDPSLTEEKDGEKEIAILGRIKPEWIVEKKEKNK